MTRRIPTKQGSYEHELRADVAYTWWYTEDCPCCENAILACNGVVEWCHNCDYMRKPVGAPLDSQDDGDFDEIFTGAGLA